MGIHSIAFGATAPSLTGITSASADKSISTPQGLPSKATDSFAGTVTGSLWSLGRSLVGGITAPSRLATAKPQTLAADAAALRSFALDLVKASGREGPEQERASAIRSAMAEHPEVVLWICEGRDLGEIARSADLPTLPDGTSPVLAVLAQLASGIQKAWSTLESYSALTYSLSAANSYYSALPEGSLFSAAEAMTVGVGSGMVRRMGPRLSLQCPRGSPVNRLRPGLRG
jgi:hypothetical protein